MSTTVAQLNGLFYEKYADKIETLYQRISILKDDIAFVPASKQNGGNYNAPVVMSPEAGFTYAAPAASGPVAMNAAISMVMANAQVTPYQMGARFVLDYESANRSVGSKAFEPAALLQMTNVLENAHNRLELSMLYGQEGLGSSSLTSVVDSTTTTVTFTAASWSDAAWGTMQNAQVNFFDTSTGALISSGADAIFTVTAVNVSTRVVTVTGTATGNTALAADDTVECFFRGARSAATTFAEMPGLSKIITNTGTLFGINAATYDLWRGNSYSVGGALTFAKVQSAVTLAVGRGLLEDVVLYVNPKTWGNLLTEQAALRMYDSSYSTGTSANGSKEIAFYSQNGKVTIKTHPFVKEGDAFILPTKRCARVGSTDITFTAPGAKGAKEMFVDLQDSMGYQAKLYSGQTVFLSTPAKAVKLTGIVNT